MSQFVLVSLCISPSVYQLLTTGGNSMLTTHEQKVYLHINENKVTLILYTYLIHMCPTNNTMWTSREWTKAIAHKKEHGFIVIL